ncbi:MAG: hypothetical protein IT226_08105 [Flavobacteriales bacterium]|nr:hypothetical protein [Flavobacteriales bacterium]
MKHILLFAAALLSSAAAVAVDRIVEEFGVPPTYPNINAAVTAAADGDRIIIKNRAGDIPWIENITIDKSLQFLSYADNGFFVVQGNYTVTTAVGRQVTIIGMRNTSGNITGTAAGTLRSTSVRVVDSQLVSGYIAFTNDAFNVEVVACSLQAGYVRINFGDVVGNDILNNQSAEGVRVTPSSTVFQNDTCHVIGNKIQGVLGYEGIFISSNAQVMHIRNNFIRHGWMGIEVYGGNTSGVQNLIWNNSVQGYTGSSTTYGISLANTSTGSIWEVMNNAIGSTWAGTNRGINKDSGNNGQINVYFNHVQSGFNTAISTGFTFEGSNTINQPVTFNPDGSFLNAPAAINGGNPAAPFYDLDLSTGDAGAYGGSYTLTNFHPLHTGAARVYMTGHPFNVRQGSNLRVKATAFDR